MKKLKKLAAVILTAAMVLSFAGCSARTPVSADEFSKQAKAQGFTVKDNSSSSSNADVDKYIDAVKSETQTEIVFISFKTESAAEEAFTSVKKNVSQGTNAKTTTVDSATYNKYTVSVGELNHTLIRMDSTIVYGKATAAYQNQVDGLLKAIKY